MENRDCFLLSYVKYGDYDAVLHCFSKEKGYGSFFVKGIYSPKNKKKPYLFPLSRLKISLAIPNKDSSAISTVTKIDGIVPEYGVDDVRLSSVLFFVADFLNQILREESHFPQAFQEIEFFCKKIQENNSGSYIILLFRFLRILGISPLFQNSKYLHSESGTFTDENSAQVFDEDISNIWKKLLIADNPYQEKLTRSERNLFLDSLIIYYQWHFNGFKVPNSLSVLRDIYS